MATVRHGVILAGGSGTRLWPASRRARPKQFIPFGAGGESMLEAAVTRAALVTDGAIAVVTAATLIEPTHAVVARLPAELRSRVTIIAEPVGRNTAAAIGLAAATLAARDPAATLVILPADQRVADERGFATAVERGLAAVDRDDLIGTIGIVPTRPDTGFGYLEVDDSTPNRVTPVLRFVEKPDRATAERYLAAGTYLWNAGMFLVRAGRVLAELDAHLSPTGQAVRAIAAGTARAEDVYPTLPSISFDHAVMERASRVVCVPAVIGWDDVGSWTALAGLDPHSDERGNAAFVVGETPSAVVVDGERNYIASDAGTLVVALGVQDLVIVKSGDAILVASKAAAQDVRKVIAELERRNLTDFL
jgi:mannose-1-phosphate guanylyltransferase